MTHILVVEDEKSIADFVRRGLVLTGYEVDVAYDGEAALSLARERMPDLVILDLMLPGIDGVEICRRLRAASDVPVIVLTARDSVAIRCRAWRPEPTTISRSRSHSTSWWRGCGRR